jgi:hypothetical protein
MTNGWSFDAIVPPSSGLNDGPGYEFTADEAARIAKLAWRVRVWGILALVSGIIGVLAFTAVWLVIAGRGWSQAGFLLASGVVMAPVMVVNAIIAVLYIGAGKSLRSIVDTQQQDIPHLMDGLERLGGAFRIETILGSIGIVMGSIALYTVVRDIAG